MIERGGSLRFLDEALARVLIAGQFGRAGT